MIETPENTTQKKIFSLWAVRKKLVGVWSSCTFADLVKSVNKSVNIHWCCFPTGGANCPMTFGKSQMSSKELLLELMAAAAGCDGLGRVPRDVQGEGIWHWAGNLALGSPTENIFPWEEPVSLAAYTSLKMCRSFLTCAELEPWAQPLCTREQSALP